MKRSWWLATAVIVALAAAVSAFLFHRAPPAHAKATAAAPPIQTEVTAIGTVQFAQVVNVPVPVDGTVDQFLAETGQHVSSGEVLARIRNPRLGAAEQAARLDVEQARNRLSQLESALIASRLEVSRSEADAARLKLEVDQAEKTFQRQQIMFREGVTPRRAFEKAERDYNSLKAESQKLVESSRKAAEQVDAITAQLDPARKALAQKTSDFEDAQAAAAVGEVNSPDDGVIIARRGKPGGAVTPAISDLFQIAVDPIVLQVVASIDPRSAARIKPGQPVVIQSDIPGTVREVKSGQVFIQLTNPPPGLKTGMTVHVKIKLS